MRSRCRSGVPRKARSKIARLNQNWRSHSQVKPIPPWSSKAPRATSIARVRDVRLRDRGGALGASAGVVQGVRREPPEPARRLDVGHEVRELVLHRLELRERRAELLPRLRRSRA